MGLVGRMCSGQYILNLLTVYAAVYDELLCEVMCVVHVKYCNCNHLLAVDMVGVACRGQAHAQNVTCIWSIPVTGGPEVLPNIVVIRNVSFHEPTCTMDTCR